MVTRAFNTIELQVREVCPARSCLNFLSKINAQSYIRNGRSHRHLMLHRIENYTRNKYGWVSTNYPRN